MEAKYSLFGRRTGQRPRQAHIFSAVKDALTAVRTVLKRKPFAKEASHGKNSSIRIQPQTIFDTRGRRDAGHHFGWLQTNGFIDSDNICRIEKYLSLEIATIAIHIAEKRRLTLARVCLYEIFASFIELYVCLPYIRL